MTTRTGLILRRDDMFRQAAPAQPAMRSVAQGWGPMSLRRPGPLFASVLSPLKEISPCRPKPRLKSYPQ